MEAIRAVSSVQLTPWNWYHSDQGILFTLGILGALIGPLFAVDETYTMSTTGR